jgi:hypothetical protein
LVITGPMTIAYYQSTQEFIGGESADGGIKRADNFPPRMFVPEQTKGAYS